MILLGGGPDFRGGVGLGAQVRGESVSGEGVAGSENMEGERREGVERGGGVASARVGALVLRHHPRAPWPIQ